MTCVHLQQLYGLCQEHDLKFSSSDLVHIICRQCQREEVCPSVLWDEYETKHPELASSDVSGEDKRDRAAP